MYEYGYGEWDVALFGLKKQENAERIWDVSTDNGELTIVKPLRNMGKKTADGLGAEVSSQRRFASQGIEQLGLDEKALQDARYTIEKECNKNEDEVYRRFRQKPLLILFVGDLKDGENVYQDVPVYALSFPFSNDKTKDYKGVEYRVNQQYIRENYGEFESDEEDEYDATK